MYYINYFFIFSILGHLLETFICSNGVSGVFFSYWTPIYGIGTIIILLVNKCINKTKLNKFFKILTLFIVSAVLLSSIEALGGYLIKWLFNKELWNYSKLKFNIGRYAALEMALIWGLSSILLIYFFKPVVDKFVNKIPKLLSCVLISLFIIDVTATIIFKII